jgi:hypothetical protein
MGEEKRDNEVGYSFKPLLKEALSWKRNNMMDNFVQILRGFPTSDTSTSSGGTAPFKVKSILTFLYLKFK